MSASGTVKPAIPDFSTGKELISRVPLADQQLAFNDLIRFFGGLQTSPLDAKNAFQLLELARPPVTYIAKELAKSYLNKPVPFGDVEENSFRQAILLLQKMTKAYARCGEKISPNMAQMNAALFAAILHRCIHFTGTIILEHQHARREIPWGLWIELHGYYGTAEELELSTLMVPNVPDSQTQPGTTHCTATYIAFILCDMTGGYGLSLHEQNMARHWATEWSSLVSLHAISLGEALPRFIIDLTHDTALRPAAESLNTSQLRRLDTSRLAAQIDGVRQQLKERVSPAELGLGDGYTPLQCSRLLEHLARQWSQARAIRKYRRHPSSGTTRVCMGFEEMHFFISGSEFQQPESMRAYSRQDYDRLFAFRFQENPGQAMHIAQEKFSSLYKVDTWEMVNQSATGFRLLRSVSGRKMVHGQLLALCPHDSQRFLLAQAVWLMQEHKGGLIAGLQALPGLPTAISARTTEQKGELYQRAFLISAPAATRTEPSLVLPTGWYRPGRVIEIHDEERAQPIRLMGLLDSGPGFERFRFELC